MSPQKLIVKKYFIGVDEVGRGPLAGPVVVGVFCIAAKSSAHAKKTLATLFPGARDSKKLSPSKREEIFEKMKAVAKTNSIYYSVQFESARSIDAKGLSWTIKSCIKKALRKVQEQTHLDLAKTFVLLDGGLKAPVEYIHQQTIIRGDDSELVISLASIAAKVTRDRHMAKLAKKYPAYNFGIHKGYGTLIHRRAIRRHGFCPEHRQSFSAGFLRNIRK